jgi:hypothetical protein
MRWITLLALAACNAASAVAADVAPARPQLTAEQIAQKNVAARGGLEAWPKVQTMAWAGHMEGASASMPGMSSKSVPVRPGCPTKW